MMTGSYCAFLNTPPILKTTLIGALYYLSFRLVVLNQVTSWHKQSGCDRRIRVLERSNSETSNFDSCVRDRRQRYKADKHRLPGR
jgi:hypothetical protein